MLEKLRQELQHRLMNDNNNYSNLEYEEYKDFDSTCRTAVFIERKLTLISDLNPTILSRKLRVSLCVIDNKILLYDGKKKLLKHLCFEVDESFPHSLQDFVCQVNTVRVCDGQKTVYFEMPNDTFTQNLAENLEHHCTDIINKLRRQSCNRDVRETVSGEVAEDVYDVTYCPPSEFLIPLKPDPTTIPEPDRNSINRCKTELSSDQPIEKDYKNTTTPKSDNIGPTPPVRPRTVLLLPTILKSVSCTDLQTTTSGAARNSTEILLPSAKSANQISPQTTSSINQSCSVKDNEGSFTNDVNQKPNYPKPAPRLSKLQFEKSEKACIDNSVIKTERLHVVKQDLEVHKAKFLPVVPERPLTLPPSKPKRSFVPRTAHPVFAEQPRNLLHSDQDIPSIPYFGTNLSAKQAETLLRQPNGTFVVRDKKSVGGGYTVLLVHNASLCKFAVNKTSSGTYFVEEPTKDFASLGELISYYQQNNIAVLNPATGRTSNILLRNAYPNPD